MIKPIAAVLIVALLVVGMIASTFIACGFSISVKCVTDVEIGVDHEPAPTLIYHIKRENKWGT